MSIDYKTLKTLEDILNTNEEQFRSSYWLSHQQFLTLYNIITKNGTEDFLKNKPIKKILLYLNYIKQYPTFRQLYNMTGHSTRTIQDIINNTAQELNEIFDKFPINWDDRKKIEPLTIEYGGKKLKVYGIIDSTFFMIEKPKWEYQQFYYSEKHKQHGIKFEFIVDHMGNIIWCSDWFYEGSIHDLKLSRLSGVLELELEENERVLGDLGYVSKEEEYFFVTTLSDNLSQYSDVQIVINSILKPRRQIIENLFGRQKSSLGIFKTEFRGDISFFGDIIRSIVFIFSKVVLPSEPLRKNI